MKSKIRKEKNYEFYKRPEFATNFAEVCELNKLEINQGREAKWVDALRNKDLMRSL